MYILCIHTLSYDTCTYTYTPAPIHTHIHVHILYTRLLDLGFTEEVEELVKQCPPGRQTLLFSATLTNKVYILYMCAVCIHVRCIFVVPPYYFAIPVYYNKYVITTSKLIYLLYTLIHPYIHRTYRWRIWPGSPSVAPCG